MMKKTTKTKNTNQKTAAKDQINWSEQQRNIFAAVQNSSNNLRIEALAGSGKTTTLIECLSYLDSSWVALAFAAKNEDDLKQKAPPTGKVYTFNKLGYSILHQSLKSKFKFEKTKNQIILEKLTKKNFSSDLLYDLSQALTLGKSCFVQSQADVLDLIEEYNLNLDEELENEEFADLVLEALELSKQEISLVDFQDQVWLPVVLGLEFPEFENILVDETQDLDLLQVEFVTCLMNRSAARLIYFGDSHQAMYHFRGASGSAMEELAERFQVNSLPLSISYRCAKKPIELAQTIVPEIEARPDAPDGLVESVLTDDLLTLAQPGCFILSRVNAPLLSLTLKFIKNKIPCNIQGRDVGFGLLNLIKKSRAKSLDSLTNFILRWTKEEKEKYEKKKKNPEHILDKAECLILLIKGSKSLEDLQALIERVFSNEGNENKIICSTVHRAKGLERKDVFVLMNTFFLKSEQEENIRYVAYTRAKENLYLVYHPKTDKKNQSEKNQERLEQLEELEDDISWEDFG